MAGPGTFGYVPAGASTTTALAAGARFTGDAVICEDFTVITVSVLADRPSAPRGLQIQRSSDGTNWDMSSRFTVRSKTGRLEGEGGESFAVPVDARYMRVVYDNGASAQGVLRLQTVLHTRREALSLLRLDEPLEDGYPAAVTRAVMAARSPDGIHRALRLAADGALEVAAPGVADLLQELIAETRMARLHLASMSGEHITAADA